MSGGDGRVYQRGGKWWMDWTDAAGARHRRSLGLPSGAKESAAKGLLKGWVERV